MRLARSSMTGFLDGMDYTPVGIIGEEVKTTSKLSDWSQERCDTEVQADFYGYYLFYKHNVTEPIINYRVFDKKTGKRENYLKTQHDRVAYCNSD